MIVHTPNKTYIRPIYLIMGFAAELTAALALVVVVYWWFKHVSGVRNKLKWCKKKEGLPIIGNALEFSGGSTGEFIKNNSKIKLSVL